MPFLKGKLRAPRAQSSFWTMLLGTLVDLVIASDPSPRLQILDGSICHTRHKGSHGLKDKTSMLCKFALGPYVPDIIQ